MKLTKVWAIGMFAAAFSAVLHAGVTAPELDPGTVTSACLLIGGAVLIVRANRKK
jgi:hypothetical protein